MTSKRYIYDIPREENHAANKVFKWIKPGSIVLEIGCASGIQSRVLNVDMNCEVTGIEIDKIAAEDARPYCKKLIIGDISKIDLALELKEKTFDFILFIDVLEHLTDPCSTLKKVIPYLKPGGQLIASIPNIAHAAICWELAHGRFDYKKYGLLDNTHVRFFTKKSMAKLLEDSGYKIELLDRVILAPEDTEFDIHCASSIEISFMDWIIESNPEAKTYQFIIKAQPDHSETKTLTHHQLESIDTIHKLEANISEFKEKINKLNSQLKWLERNRYGFATNFINKLLHKISKTKNEK